MKTFDFDSIIFLIKFPNKKSLGFCVKILIIRPLLLLKKRERCLPPHIIYYINYCRYIFFSQKINGYYLNYESKLLLYLLLDFFDIESKLV